MDAIARDVREFIVTNFLYGEAGGLTDDQSFLDNGIVDSTGVLELVGYLEQQFGIHVSDRDLVPENLDSIVNVARYVERKLAVKAAEANAEEVRPEKVKTEVAG